MEIKRIKDQSIHDAIRKVRDELGPDAVILSTEKNSQGVEIIAAVDFDPTALEKKFSEPQLAQEIPDAEAIKEIITHATEQIVSEKLGNQESSSDIEQKISEMNESIVRLQINVNQERNKIYDNLSEKFDNLQSSLEAKYIEQQKSRSESFKVLQNQITQLREEFSEYVSSTHPTEMDSLLQIQDEIGDLKSVLGCQAKLLDWTEWAKNNPRSISLVSRLVNAGFGVHLSKKLISSIGNAENLEKAWVKSIDLLTTGIKPSAWDYMKNGGVIMAMGRTGVGKTTTLAKLATNYVIENGPDDVAFINLDDQHVGSYDQLDTYAKILNVPVYRYDGETNLEQITRLIRSKKLVLIDTAGMNKPDENIETFIANMAKRKIKLNKLLLMSANTQLHNLREAVSSYSECNPNGCVITKTDESSQLGNVLTVAIEDSMPIWYETFGQKIPEDIRAIDASDLIQRAIEFGSKVNTREHDDELIFEELNQYAITE